MGNEATAQAYDQPNKKQSRPKAKSPKKAKPRAQSPVDNHNLISQSKIEAVVVKKAHWPSEVPADMKQRINSFNLQLQEQFRNRLLLKASKNELRLVCADEEGCGPPTDLTGCTMKQLQEHCNSDIEIYRRVLEMRQDVGVAEWLRTNQWVKEDPQSIRQALKNVLESTSTVLLGEIEGMSAAWHSLHHSLHTKRIKLVTFIHQEGIDSKQFPRLPALVD